MQTRICLVLLLIGCLCPVVMRSIPSQSTSHESNHAIVIESGRDHGTYHLKVRPNPRGDKDALHLLTALCRGGDFPVLSLVDESAKIDDLYNAQRLASKAQCQNVKTFIVDRERGQMYEITFGKGIPIPTALPGDAGQR